MHTVSKAVEERVAFEIVYSPMTSSSPLSRTAPSASTFPCVDPTYSELSASASGGNVGRRNVVAGGKEVVRVTKGKGVIVSSGAARWNEMRAPDDVANLCVPSLALVDAADSNRAQLVGLSSDQARKAVSSNALTIVKRGGESRRCMRARLTAGPEMTRQTYRGIISNPVLVTTPRAKRARSDEDEQGDAKR